MLYTELTKKALKICFDAHKDKVDKCGIPYVTHPLHLAEQMPDEITTVTALKENPVARRVKLADLEHNSDLSRIDHVTERDLARIRKYRKAMELLEGGAENG